jgi:predicted  nucleic acid-binding Zn-ribbon protein
MAIDDLMREYRELKKKLVEKTVEVNEAETKFSDLLRQIDELRRSVYERTQVGRAVSNDEMFMALYGEEIASRAIRSKQEAWQRLSGEVARRLSELIEK